MLTLRSPDKRLRLDFALLAGGRAADSGVPALRVTRGGCTLLGWSRLAPDSSAEWRSVAAPRARCRGATSECLLALAPSAGRAPRLRLALRCADGGVAFRVVASTATGAWRAVPRFRLPRGSQALVADPATGSFAFHMLPGGMLAIDGGGRESNAGLDALLPLTFLYPHGKCAALLRLDIGTAPWWLLLAGDRPCDLPSGVAVEGLLTHELASANRADGSIIRPSAPSFEFPVSSFEFRVSSSSAQFNCFLPFTRAPDWPRAALAEAAWTQPRTTGVTAAHRRALHLLMGTLPPHDEAGEPAAARIAWSETLWLRGEMGEYVLLARRHGACWWVGAITVRPRVLTLLLEFLAPGVRYRARAWRDDEGDASAPAPPPLLDADSKPVLQLGAAGGFLLRLEPENGPC